MAHAQAAATIRAFMAEKHEGGLDAIVINTSGCGTTVKDYGHMFRNDAAYAEKARAVSAKACDITELLVKLSLPQAENNLRVTYHSACSMQHGCNTGWSPFVLLGADKTSKSSSA